MEIKLNYSDIPDIKGDLRKYILEETDLLKNDNGIWLEFGVYSGRTINYISKFTKNTVYGFDSFEGLPEYWRPNFEKGSISAGGKLPKVEDNVELIKGLFQDTLPSFLDKQEKKSISLVHIDSDLYSSCKYVFNQLKSYFKKDCIIIFDELFNYPGYENGELKALNEFNNENKIKFEWIGMNGIPGKYYNDGQHHENCAIKLTEIIE